MATLTIYRAFIEGELEGPKHLARRVHDLYFNPQHDQLAPRTIWSLANAFTSAFKELDPIPPFWAAAQAMFGPIRRTVEASRGLYTEPRL